MIDSFQESVIQARAISKRMHPSRKWQPVKHVENLTDEDPGKYPGTTNGTVEIWENDLYEINVRRYLDGWPFAHKSRWIYIGIAALDGAARHDWREMQRIKNEICGPEWDAIELFPAESRLLDPSNYFILFCAPKISIGLNGGRNISGPSNTVAPQRGWAQGEEPADSGRFLEPPSFSSSSVIR